MKYKCPKCKKPLDGETVEDCFNCQNTTHNKQAKQEFGICPECTADAFIKKLDGKREINCGYCGKYEIEDEDFEYQRETVKNLTGVDL